VTMNYVDHMKFKANNIRTQIIDNSILEIVFTTKEKVNIDGLKQIIENGKEISVEAKQYRQKRSLDSNSYCWILCQKIAEVIHSTKELVYKKVIKDVGQFELMPIKNEAVERWQKVWESKGMGWFSEVLEDSKLEGYKKIVSYYGSSCYDVREMCVLINEIVAQCKKLGIETISSNELERMKSAWGR